MTNKIGFSAEYVEAISPVERELYVSYYIEEEKRKDQENKKRGGAMIGTPIGQ